MHGRRGIRRVLRRGEISVPADGAGTFQADDGCMFDQISHRDTTTGFESATVADAMTTGVVRCRPQASLRAVARLMAEHRVHAVFVFDRAEDDDVSPKPWGLVSDLDVAAAAWAGIDTRRARDSAVVPLITVRSDERLEYAAQLMADNGVSHLAVIDAATHRPAGLIATLDIARIVAHR